MIIDRFEGDFAICEDNGKMISISRQELPDNCREGTALILENNVYKILNNSEDRKRIREKMRGLMAPRK